MASEIDIKVIARDLASSVLNNIRKNVDSFASKVGEGIKQLGAITSGVFLGLAGGAIALGKESIQAFANYEKSLTTLGIIASRFNVNADDATEAAKGLAKELRIGVGSSANALQNLLASGLNLEQATDLLRRFTNEAITGKSDTISLSQAVENLSFAYKTNNSAIGNLSGINENFQDIIERGAKLMGKEVKDLTDAELAMAKYRGMIDLTNLTMGSSEKFQGTFIDNLAILQTMFEDLRVEIGSKLVPKINDLFITALDSGLVDKITETILKMVDGFIAFTDLLVENKDTIKDIATTFGIIAGVVGVVAAVIAALSSPLGIALALITAISVILTKLGINFDVIKEKAIPVFQSIAKTIENIVAAALPFLVEQFEKLSPLFIELFNQGKLLFDTLKFALFDNKEATSNLAFGFGAFVTQAVEGIKQVIEAVILIIKWINDHKAELRSLASIASQIFAFIAGLIGTVISVVGWLIKKIAEGTIAISNWGAEANKKLQPVIETVKSIYNWFSDLIGKINKAVESVKKFDVGGIAASVGGLFAGARAAGGPVSSGKTYLVGENGPELFSPNSSGNIIPNHAMGGQNTFNVSISMSGANEMDARKVARVFIEEVKSMATQQGIDLGNFKQLNA